MNLSMWILADKLQQYAPELSVGSGDMVLTGARPLLPGQQRREDILYISPAPADQCPDGQPRVLCSHGPDRMLLHTADADRVLAEVLDIFESLQHWQTAVEAASRQGRSVQYLADISSEALPFPMVIFDAFGNVVGYSKNYDAYCEQDAYWASVVQNQQMSRQVFTEVADPERRARRRDWDATPQIYQTLQSRVVGMHLTREDAILGTMILIELGGRLTRGVCQLVALLHDPLSRALSIRDDGGALRGMMVAAADYLDGKAADRDRLWETVRHFTGRGEGELELLLLKNPQRSDFTYKNNLAYRLTNSEQPCFALVYHDCVAVLLPCRREQEFLQALWRMLPQNVHSCGVSLPFADPAAMQRAAAQAALALESGGQAPGMVLRCEDYAYTYFLNRLADDEDLSGALRHPGLARLRSYDEQHGTEFYETLYRYLLLERNVTDTSKALNVHRNSLLYRLRRIQELLGRDLEDPQFRMYLLLSYQLRQVQDGRRSAGLAL